MDKLKAKCSGPEQHVNDIDLGKLLQGTTILRKYSAYKTLLTGTDLQNKYEMRCSQCASRVAITREIIEDFLKTQKA